MARISMGYLKHKVFANKPRNLIELKTHINEINAISVQVLQKFVNQLGGSIEENGGHLRQTIFRT